MFKKISRILEIKITILQKQLNQLNQLNKMDARKQWDLETGKTFNDLINRYAISEEELLSISETVCKFVTLTRKTNIDKYIRCGDRVTTLLEVKSGEGRKLEFKERLPENIKIAKTAVAFSNGAGGKLIIGVNDDGEIIGVPNEDIVELPDKITNIIYDMCYPMIIPEIYSENTDGKNIIIIEV
jgi:hypothetical protein